MYFHSAREGMKIDYIRSNPNVCFELEGEAEIVRHGSIPCDFTFSYLSVIGFGEVSEITEKDEKQKTLKIILSHYSKKEWNVPFPMLLAVRVWRIRITGLFGKQSKKRT
ncbi:pyridoxamine 5'-phosphate oxidase family protein [Candidatus Omnitrophota bacterium]